MAQKHVITLVDDLDGSEADETVEFALDGARYEIDLSKSNANELRDALSTYVAHARRARGGSRGPAGRRGGRPARADREQTQRIREWARKNGFQVGEKGRIPGAVMEAYNKAN